MVPVSCKHLGHLPTERHHRLPCLPCRYDCEVLVKGKPPQLLVRFDGYGTSDDEAIESLDRLRFSSVPCEVRGCGS